MDPADPTSLDEAKELLYGLPLKSFVAERDFLVKQIWAAGNRDLANEVKTLRKPSMVAAEVNHIVRADPEGVDLILQAATLLRAAQTGALEGSTIDASELQQQYRAAIRGLSQSAPTRRAEVRAALEAATIDEASQDDLRSGCLVVVPTTVSVFGTAPPSPAIAPTSATEEPSPPVDELEARRVRRRASNDKDQPQADEEGAAEQANPKQTKKEPRNRLLPRRKQLRRRNGERPRPRPSHNANEPRRNGNENSLHSRGNTAKRWGPTSLHSMPKRLRLPRPRTLTRLSRILRVNKRHSSKR